MEVEYSYSNTTTLTIEAKKVVFTNNTVLRFGGAIFSETHSLVKASLLSGKFMNNGGGWCGGAVHVENRIIRYINITLKNFSAVNNSGSALCVYGANITFEGTTLFMNNTGSLSNGGGGINSNNSILTVIGHAMFNSNKASYGGAINSLNGALIFSGITSFTTNTASWDGGALHAINTGVVLNSMVNFTSNAAKNGGAMYFSASTFMRLAPHSH